MARMRRFKLIGALKDAWGFVAGLAKMALGFLGLGKRREDGRKSSVRGPSSPPDNISEITEEADIVATIRTGHGVPGDWHYTKEQVPNHSDKFLYTFNKPQSPEDSCSFMVTIGDDAHDLQIEERTQAIKSHNAAKKTTFDSQDHLAPVIDVVQPTSQQPDSDPVTQQPSPEMAVALSELQKEEERRVAEEQAQVTQIQKESSEFQGLAAKQKDEHTNAMRTLSTSHVKNQEHKIQSGDQKRELIQNVKLPGFGKRTADSSNTSTGITPKGGHQV